MNISMKLVYQYMAIFFNFSTTSSHLHPLQAENCDSNSRLVVDEDDNGKFRPERVILIVDGDLESEVSCMKLVQYSTFSRLVLIWHKPRTK